MKVVHEIVPPKFMPVVLTIVLETQEEVDVLYQLGNHNTIVKTLLKEHCKIFDWTLLNHVLHPIYKALYTYVR